MDPNRLKRLRYRSWHRGCKETDIVLGPFADSALDGLDKGLVDRYEALLDESDSDIWNWLAGREDAPEAYRTLIAMMQAMPPAATRST